MSSPAERAELRAAGRAALNTALATLRLRAVALDEAIQSITKLTQAPVIPITTIRQIDTLMLTHTTPIEQHREPLPA